MTQIAKSGVRFAVETGDTAYPSGSQTNYGDLRQTGSDVSAVFGPQFWPRFGGSIPFFNATGNHGLQQHIPRRTGRRTRRSSSSGGQIRHRRPTAAPTGRARKTTRAPGTRSTPATPASTSWRRRGLDRTSARRTSTRTTTTPLGAWHPGIPVARQRPRGSSVAAEVRVLPLPDVLVERDRVVRPLAARREQPRGPAREERRGHRVQRPRPQLHAQRKADGWARHVRHRRGRRPAPAGDQMQRAGGVRDRVVLLRREGAPAGRSGRPRSTRSSTSSR